jgi:hypothetical protein
VRAAFLFLDLSHAPLINALANPAVFKDLFAWKDYDSRLQTDIFPSWLQSWRGAWDAHVLHRWHSRGVSVPGVSVSPGV